jgi:uncharacterized protein YndB with AHSA1/START domain
MLKLTSETRIAAPPAAVFEAMTDLDGYARWNPWNVRGAGRAVEGELVDITVKLGRRTPHVRHRILEVKPHERFQWCDVGWFTRVAYGQRTRTLQPDGDGVRYHVELTVSGPLAWLVKWQMGRDLERGLAEETAALKKFVEKT